ncbi:MAG: hypothetical protein KAJ75_01870 [Alphaproteobacteria bacterium]|nr:hypothetical protein [Alphaproteobacteria bacterium]
MFKTGFQLAVFIAPIILAGCSTANSLRVEKKFLSLPEDIGQPVTDFRKCVAAVSFRSELPKVDFDRLDKVIREAKKETSVLRRALINSVQPLEKIPKYYSGYANYSAGFQGTKTLLQDGNFQGAAYRYAVLDYKPLLSSNADDELAEKIGLLGLLERGAIALDYGNSKCSRQFFKMAEMLVNERDDNTLAGYEHVLMLNLKAISHLLDSDFGAYNVTRRARDLQAVERDKFKKRIDESREKLNEKESDEKEGSFFSLAGEILSDAFKPNLDIATRISSPYVSPFSDYVSGMVSELLAAEYIRLKEDGKSRTELDSARISYKKAEKLSPKNKLVAKAKKDTAKGYKPKGKKLVHVAVGAGLAPEKKVIIIEIPIDNTIVPIKLPFYEPVASEIFSMKIYTGDGKKLAQLELLADVEAITMRHYYDERFSHILKAVSGSVGSFLIQKEKERQKEIVKNEKGKAASMFVDILGTVINAVIDHATMPNTKAFMTLPKEISVARFYVPIKLDQITVNSYDKKDRLLGSKSVKLLKKSPTFVYGRAINDNMQLFSQKEMLTFLKKE